MSQSPTSPPQNRESRTGAGLAAQGPCAVEIVVPLWRLARAAAHSPCRRTPGSDPPGWEQLQAGFAFGQQRGDDRCRRQRPGERTRQGAITFRRIDLPPVVDPSGVGAFRLAAEVVAFCAAPESAMGASRAGRAQRSQVQDCGPFRGREEAAPHCRHLEQRHFVARERKTMAAVDIATGQPLASALTSNPVDIYILPVLQHIAVRVQRAQTAREFRLPVGRA